MKQLLTWPWYQDINMCRLFVHCILKAQEESINYMGVDIPRGALWTGLDQLASETGLSKKVVRSNLTKLKQKKQVADIGHANGHARGRMITVLDYDCYMGEGTQRAHNGHTTGTQKQKRQTEEKPVKKTKKDYPSWKLFFDAYPENKKGGTDAAAWKAAQSEGLTDEDFAEMLIDVKERTKSCKSWYSTYAQGITKYIRERIWKTPIVPDINPGLRRINPDYSDLFNQSNDDMGVVSEQ